MVWNGYDDFYDGAYGSYSSNKGGKQKTLFEEDKDVTPEEIDKEVDKVLSNKLSKSKLDYLRGFREARNRAEGSKD